MIKELQEGNTPTEIQKRLQDYFSKDIDVRQGSLVGDLTRGNAEEFAYAYMIMSDVLKNSFLYEGMPSDLLTLKASEYGVYRKESVKAEALVTFTGDYGGVIPEGTRVRTSYPPYIYYTTTSRVEKPRNKDIAVKVVAEVGGEEGNVSSGRIDTIIGNLSGVLDVTNKTEAFGGSDEESDESLYDRVILKLRQPITSGNVYHYQKWATDVEGIRGAKVFPLWKGNGTVKVVLVSSQGESPDKSKIKEVEEYINSVRPIGADVTVVGAKEKPINIFLSVELRPGYNIKDVENDYKNKADLIFRDTAFKTDIVRYSRMATLALDSEGVVDWIDLTINGGTSNIPLNDDEIAVLGEVTVIEAKR